MDRHYLHTRCGVPPVKNLACVLMIVLGPLGLHAAQINPNTPPSSQAVNEPIMFTLTIDDEMIAALKQGQSLLSAVPESIRGKVDKIRIEYKPSATTQPTSQPPLNGNSILNKGTSTRLPDRFDNSNFGSPTSFQTGQPPPTTSSSGLQRSGNNFQQDSSPPSTSNSIWNRSTNNNTIQAPRSNNSILGSPQTDNRTANNGLSNLARPNQSLTPIDGNDAWLFGTTPRRDSNTILPPQSTSNTGMQTSLPSTYNPNLNRSSIDNSSRDFGAYSAPPISRSLPALEVPSFSSGITSSDPRMIQPAADSAPNVALNQTLTKPPADASTRSVLAANDSATRADNRQLVYLFMLLLCSLGLNIYLGWISRGFYVRYQELAEELRDTFTPSSAA